MVELTGNEQELFANLVSHSYARITSTGLNEYQKEKYDIFWDTINQRSNFFFSAKDRRVGKTYLINEIGFELQALGYIVYIITPVDCMEYFANGRLDLSPERYARRMHEDVVVLLDEVFISEQFLDFLDYCRYRQVPVIGFVRYPNIERGKRSLINPIDFKMEYECKWIPESIECKNGNGQIFRL